MTREELWESMRREGELNFLKHVKDTSSGSIDTSRIKYHNSQTPVELGCTIHGVWYKQKPNNFSLGKAGCVHCRRGKKHLASKIRITNDQYIAECRSIHGDTYDYSKTDYVSAHKPVIIGCRIHGEFEQIARLHKKGAGCRQCGFERTKQVQLGTLEEFLTAAKEIHGDRYDYSKFEYKGNLIPSTIICKIHGEWAQAPKDHKNGSGCHKCGFFGPSQPELEIGEFIRGLGVEYLEGDREVIKPQELDIYIPDRRLAIEYNGLYYHSEKFVDSRYHLDKTEKCLAKGIDLIQIFEDEWACENKREIVKSIIASRLGKYKRKLYARNTVKVEISAKEAKSFLEANHLQGFAASKKYYGLKTKNGELVSVMLLTEPRKGITVSKNTYDLELVRFASLLNTQVVGGFSKLLTFAGSKSVVTYCDRRVFNAMGYEAVGFERLRNNPPEYYYTLTKRDRQSRLGFQKKHLAGKLPKYDPDKTERENMRDNGYLRVYGCGTTTLVYNFDKSVIVKTKS